MQPWKSYLSDPQSKYNQYENQNGWNQKESFDHSVRIKELIEWVEDKQLEDEIEKRSWHIDVSRLDEIKKVQFILITFFLFLIDIFSIERNLSPTTNPWLLEILHPLNLTCGSLPSFCYGCPFFLGNPGIIGVGPITMAPVTVLVHFPRFFIDRREWSGKRSYPVYRQQPQLSPVVAFLYHRSQYQKIPAKRAGENYLPCVSMPIPAN